MLVRSGRAAALAIGAALLAFATACTNPTAPATTRHDIVSAGSSGDVVSAGSSGDVVSAGSSNLAPACIVSAGSSNRC